MSPRSEHSRLMRLHRHTYIWRRDELATDEDIGASALDDTLETTAERLVTRLIAY